MRHAIMPRPSNNSAAGLGSGTVATPVCGV